MRTAGRAALWTSSPSSDGLAPPGGGPGGAGGFGDQLAELARAAAAEVGPVATVGVGVPGLHDPATGRTRFLPNIPGDWAGVPVVDPIRAALGVPTVMINDARAFALAELRLGAGRGSRSLLGITLG